jgi:hypothetical protein
MNISLEEHSATHKEQISFLRLINIASWSMLLGSTVFQLVFFPEVENIAAIIAVYFSWFLVTKVWLQPRMLNTYLISSFMIICFVLSRFYLPLIFTTIENKPLIFNLELPEEVFLHGVLALLIIGLAHGIYIFIMNSTPTRSLSLMEKIGFFTPPSHVQLWIMALIGTASSLYVYFFFPEIGGEVTGDPTGKLFQALVPFTYAPFFIPLSKLYGNNEKMSKSFIPMILAYSALMLAISIGRNSRGAFMIGLTNPVFAYGLGLMLAVFHAKIFTFKNFAIAGVILFGVTGPLSDLATAMLVVRDQKKDVTATELISQTLETFNDKDAIRQRREFDLSQTFDPDWDEHYMDNIFTARFANIKFADLNLVTYHRLGENDPDMQEFSLEQVLAIFPDPVIKMFGFDIDKTVVLSMSFGDFQYVLSGGVGTPTAFRVGNFSGTGMATFGWWYLAILGVICIPCFYLNDKFFRPSTVVVASDGTKTFTPFKLSFCAVLALTHYYYFFDLESVVSGVTYLIRGYLQILLLYLIVFHISRAAAAVLPSTRKSVRSRIPAQQGQHI